MVRPHSLSHPISSPLTSLLCVFTSIDVNLDCQIDTCTEVAVFTCITNSAVATGARWFIDGREDFDTAVFKPEFIPAHGTALLSASVDAVDSVSTIQCSLTFPSGEVLSSDEIPIGSFTTH